MIRYEPRSYSKIAAATHIVEAELQAYLASEWRRDEELPLNRRDVTATLAIQRIWKGDSAVLPGGVVPVTFTQYAYINQIRFALPGPWSGHELVEGARYFLFAAGSSTEILQEPELFFIETPEAAALDVELAARSGCPSIRLGALIEQAAPHLPHFGTLFPEYVVSRLPEMFFNYGTDYHNFMKLLESPDAPVHVRWLWLREITAWLSMMDPAPPTFLARTLIGFLHVAAAAGPDMSKAILTVYLPNLLGLTGGLKRKQAGDIFQGLSTALQQTVSLLEARLDLPNAGQLLVWLRGQ